MDVILAEELVALQTLWISAQPPERKEARFNFFVKELDDGRIRVSVPGFAVKAKTMKGAIERLRHKLRMTALDRIEALLGQGDLIGALECRMKLPPFGRSR